MPSPKVFIRTLRALARSSLGNNFADRFGKQSIRKLGLILSYAIAMLPFIAVIHNLNVLA